MLKTTQLQLVHDLLDTFSTLNADGINKNISLRTADCTHTILPKSLGIPMMNNTQLEAHMSRLGEVLEGIPVTPVEVLYGGGAGEGVGGRVVTVHATSTAVFKAEAMIDSDNDGDGDGDATGGDGAGAVDGSRAGANSAGKTDWSYEGEYIFVITFNESGEKIQRVLEFVDSKAAAEALGLVVRGKRNIERVRMRKERAG